MGISLCQRTVEEGPILATRIVVLGIGDDAYDLVAAGELLAVIPKMASERILIGKELLDESLVDDGDHLRSCGVLVGEVAAADYRLAHGFKKVGAHPIP